MAQYIDKDALVAEIERKIDLFKKEKLLRAESISDKLSLGARIAMLEEIRTSLNTLEVKEVDLEKEIESAINKYYKECEKRLQELKDDDMDLSFLQLDNFATHFFELGLKAQKEE